MSMLFARNHKLGAVKCDSLSWYVLEIDIPWISIAHWVYLRNWGRAEGKSLFLKWNMLSLYMIWIKVYYAFIYKMFSLLQIKMDDVLALSSLFLVNPFTNEVLVLGIILWFQEIYIQYQISSIKLWLGIMVLGHYTRSLKTGVLTSVVFGEAPVVKFRYMLVTL